MEILIKLSLASIFLLLVIKFADIFVKQSEALASKLKISQFIIGFALVSMGTSIPELSTSLYSAYSGHTNMAIANIVGSNITNITLILGIIAFLKTFKISKEDVKYNIPLLLFSTIIVFAILILTKFTISVTIGIVLIIFFFISLYIANRENHKKRMVINTKFSFPLLILSIAGIGIFSKLCIDQVIAITQILNLSETIFGFFLLAMGTSLPELITSIQAIKSGNGEISLGNILGSNMFNLLFILGVIPFVSNINLHDFRYEVGFMVIATFLLLFFAVLGKKYSFSKKEGAFLIITYIIYILVVLNS